LQTYHPQVTFDEVLRLANFGNMTLISKKCEEALEVYMPKKDVDVGEPKPTTEVPLSVGSTSGA
jgi:hypothetical protein